MSGHDNMARRGEAPLRWIVDSAVALAVLTGAMVVLGYAIRRAYYESLSFPAYYPSDPPYTYVVASAGYGTAVILTVMGGLFTAFLASRSPSATSLMRPFLANAGFLVLPSVLLWLAISRDDITWQVWLSSGAYTVFLVALSLTFQTIIELDRLQPSSSRTTSVLAVLAFVVCFTVSDATGRGAARRLVEGTSDRGSLVQLTLKDAASPLSGSTFALVDIRDGSLFVVEMADPAPERPILHIIPQSEVVSAQVQRMNGDAPSSVSAPG